MTDDELWLPIPDFPNYEASDRGRIRNRRLGHLLAGTTTRQGYLQVSVRGPRGRRVAYVHRLVCAAFHGPPPAGHVVNHINALKQDNRPENVEWLTPAANVRHARALGLLRCRPLYGEANPQAKLTADRVREMRAKRQAGAKLTALALEYGVTPQAAQLVVSRQVWRHVA
ncbi:MAG TPA: HNH endonuclease [Urbifossiella sp.]|nr:HNH endonuclease [Urbifossiella sp.]